MYIDADASTSPRRRRISGVYSIEAHRRRRQAAGHPSVPPAPSSDDPAPREDRATLARRRRNDAEQLATALRQLGRGATVLQVAEDALGALREILAELRALAAPAIRPTFGAAQRVSHGVQFRRGASRAVELVTEASFEQRSLLGPRQPAMVLTLGRVELPLGFVDMTLVTRGMPALTLSSPIGAEAAAAVCVTAMQRADEGLTAVGRLRQDVARIVDGYRRAQQALQSQSLGDFAASSRQVEQRPARAMDSQATVEARSVLYVLR